MKKSETLYINEPSSLKKVKKNRKPLFLTGSLTLFAMLVMFIAVVPINGNPVTGNNAPVFQQADALFGCSNQNELGAGMVQGDWRGSGASGTVGGDAPGRYWTLQELAGNSTTFVSYQGEGEGVGLSWGVPDVELERGAGIGNWDSYVSRLEEKRSLWRCLGDGIFSFTATFGLRAAGMIASVTSFVATSVFNSKLICEDANSTGNCVNLLKVLGGTDSGVVTDGSGGGIIGSLTAGIYLPLFAIIVSISGLWVLWIGIVKRKYREALFGALWVFLSIMIGLTILFKPMALAKVPMAVSNVAVSCIIGSFNGLNCVTGTETTPGVDLDNSGNPAFTSNNICRSDATTATTEERAALVVNGLTCSIWKAFVLQPYSNASFGKSFDELDVSNDETREAIETAGIDPKSFCINLYSNTSYDNQGKILKLNHTRGGQNIVCNLASYQLYLMTYADANNDVITGGNPKTDANPDTRWYPLILTVAADDPGMWNAWSEGGFSQISTSIIAVITTMIGSIVIIFISIYALIYYIISIFMMAFAPLFFLFGIHPGRGKKILIGWAEMLASNVLKYIASALFLIITIQLYAAVLGSSTSAWSTLLLVFILTGALLMYRKEIVELMGKVEAGGQQLSNNMADKISNKAKSGGTRAKRVAGATVGASVGARMATRGVEKDAGLSARNSAMDAAKAQGLSDKDAKKLADKKAAEAEKAAKEQRGKVISSARKEATRREIKSGSGAMGRGGISQYERTAADNRRDFQKDARESAAKSAEARSAARDQATVVEQSETIVAEKEGAYNDASMKVELIHGKENEETYRDMVNHAQSSIAGEHPAFSKMMAITERMERLKQQRAMAVAAGNRGSARDIDAKLRSANTARDEIKNGMIGEDGVPGEEYESGKQAYMNSRNEFLRGQGFDADKSKSIKKHGQSGRKEFTDNLAEEERTRTEFNESIVSLNTDVAKLDGLRTIAAEESHRSEKMLKHERDFAAGEIVKPKTNREFNESLEDSVKQIQVAEHSIKPEWRQIKSAAVIGEGKHFTPNTAKAPDGPKDNEGGGKPPTPPNEKFDPNK